MKTAKYVLAFAALLFTALGSTPARADTIVQSGGIVTAINGITIAGTTYNVTFGTTDDTTFAGSTMAPAVRDALANDLTLSGAQFINSVQDSLLGVDGGSGLIYTSGLPDFPGLFNIPGQVSQSLFGSGVSSGHAAYAEFTPTIAAPVPEPSSLLLLGTGLLGLAGAIRRRRLA